MSLKIKKIIGIFLLNDTHMEHLCSTEYENSRLAASDIFNMFTLCWLPYIQQLHTQVFSPGNPV